MRHLRPWLLCLLVLSASLTPKAPAQSSVKMDESHRTTLPGTVHPLALAKFDQGAVAADLPLNRLLLTLARPAARDQALQQFLRDAHSPASQASISGSPPASSATASALSRKTPLSSQPGSTPAASPSTASPRTAPPSSTPAPPPRSQRPSTHPSTTSL